jgi:hypothetical protein
MFVGNQHWRIVCPCDDRITSRPWVVLAAAVVVAVSCFEIGRFKQPGDKSSCCSYGGEGSSFLLRCDVVRVNFSWFLVLLSGAMNRERLVMWNIMDGNLFCVFCCSAYTICVQDSTCM